MSQEYRITPPESMALERMSPQEIEGIVTEHASRMLGSMPDGFRPVAVNRVVLDRAIGRPGGGAGDWGGWAEWTRACCGSRAQIDDFQDPLINEIEVAGSPVMRRVGDIHVESQLRVVDLVDPETHIGPAKGG
jgi:hypothetical protein